MNTRLHITNLHCHSVYYLAISNSCILSCKATVLSCSVSGNCRNLNGTMLSIDVTMPVWKIISDIQFKHSLSHSLTLLWLRHTHQLGNYWYLMEKQLDGKVMLKWILKIWLEASWMRFTRHMLETTLKERLRSQDSHLLCPPRNLWARWKITKDN
jgi:hypothetical protein